MASSLTNDCHRESIPPRDEARRQTRRNLRWPSCPADREQRVRPRRQHLNHLDRAVVGMIWTMCPSSSCCALRPTRRCGRLPFACGIFHACVLESAFVECIILFPVICVSERQFGAKILVATCPRAMRHVCVRPCVCFVTSMFHNLLHYCTIMSMSSRVPPGCRPAVIHHSNSFELAFDVNITQTK